MSLLARLACPPTRRPADSLETFLAGLPAAPPLARAVAGGLQATCAGHAFAAGYRAALDRLVPERAGRCASLCVTEAGGNHPRAIQTRLDQGRLTGRKQWGTLAGGGDTLLVAATEGERAGRPRLRLVAVALDAPGLRLTPMPPLPFVPEVPHVVVTLDETPGTVLPGDGWETYVRPFRTVEDIHVLAALLAYWLRPGLPGAVVADLVHTLVGLGALADADPADPVVHLALGGAIAAVHRLEPLVAPHLDETWVRDRALLRVAGTARRARLDRALARTGHSDCSGEGAQ